MDAQGLGLSDEVWELLEDCWETGRELRPPVEEVLSRVKLAASTCGTLPPVGNTTQRHRDPGSDHSKFGRSLSSLLVGVEFVEIFQTCSSLEQPQVSFFLLQCTCRAFMLCAVEDKDMPLETESASSQETDSDIFFDTLSAPVPEFE